MLQGAPSPHCQEDKALPYKQPISKSSSIEIQKEKEKIRNQNYILLPMVQKINTMNPHPQNETAFQLAIYRGWQHDWTQLPATTAVASDLYKLQTEA